MLTVHSWNRFFVVVVVKKKEPPSNITACTIVFEVAAILLGSVDIVTENHNGEALGTGTRKTFLVPPSWLRHSCEILKWWEKWSCFKQANFPTSFHPYLPPPQPHHLPYCPRTCVTEERIPFCWIRKRRLWGRDQFGKLSQNNYQDISGNNNSFILVIQRDILKLVKKLEKLF